MSGPSGSSFHSLFEVALRDYEKQTGTNLVEHPLAKQLETCDSVESITAVLQERARTFSKFRGDDGKVMKSLHCLVHVLQGLSTSAVLGEAIGLSFPPAKAIFAALAVLLTAIKDASASYDALVDLLESIEHFLSRLDTYTKLPPTTAMAEIIVKIMVELLSTIALVTKQVKMKRPLKLIKKLLGENDLEAVLQRLDRLTQDEARTTAAQTLKIVYSLLQNMRAVMDDGKASVDGIRDALEIMQDIASKMNKAEREKLQHDARKWLAPPDPWKNHNIACDSHHKGTSTWFVEGETFTKWKSSDPNSLLWVHGKPGAGKSVLCSTIIEDIGDLHKRGLASMAFFYCDFRDDDKKDLRGLVSSLLVQLCYHSNPYSTILSDLYSAHNSGLREPSDDALVRCFKEMVKRPGQAPVYVIIDGLDECPNSFGIPSPREKVLMFVEELVDLHLPNLHICITSRPETDITNAFDLLPFGRVSLHDSSGQMQDIVDYVNSVVNTDPKMKKWRAVDKELVIEVLTRKADGMFRWVFCQFEFLRDCLPAGIRPALEELPESLDETYERVLHHIKKANWKFAHRLFQCVAVASRPLLVEELAEFLAFDFDVEPTPTFQEGWRPEDPVTAVLSTCSSLLAVVVDARGSRIIQFSHFSVKEFLTSTRLAESKNIILSRHYISTTLAHTLISQACLGILLHLDETVTSERLNSFPLANYAAKHWLDHARFDMVLLKVQDSIKRLFDPRTPHLSIWVWIYDPEDPLRYRSQRTESPTQPRASCLHYAALCGLHDLSAFLVMEYSQDVNASGFLEDMTALHLASRGGHVEVALALLGHSADVNAEDQDNWTPLHCASQGGHVEVVRVLLKYGANASAPDGFQSTPLHLALEGGYVDVVRVLLEHGADATAQDLDNTTPLDLALKGGDEVVRVFLECGANANVPDNSKSTPLHWASQGGHVEMARILLEHHADVNAQNSRKFTPLRLASEGGHVDVARVLLEHGASTSIPDESWLTPLQYASRSGHVEVARVLLKYGADFNPQAWGDPSPLHLASHDGHADVVRVLLEHGANVGVRNHSLGSPLHQASEGGHVEVGRVLLEHGADPNILIEFNLFPLELALQGGHTDFAQVLLEHGADLTFQDSRKRTPLHWTSEDGHVENARLLLEHGADTSVQDDSGCTPLHRASVNGHVEVAQLLREHGADTSVQDDAERTPLHRASEGGHVGIAQLLLEHGVDTNVQDYRKRTPLHRVSEDGHVEIAQLLLEHGANIGVQDYRKSTPLHLASEGGHVEIVQSLLKRGADTNVQDDSGCTPIHETCQGGHVEIAQLLLELGANTSVQDNLERTPLHWASQKGHAEIARLLLEHGVDINVQDYQKCTPLLRASAHGRTKVAQLLLEYRADTTVQDDQECTPLHRAAANGFAETAQLLLEYGVDTSVRDHRKRTPLHRASENGRAKIVRLLLEHGADTSLRDYQKCTALQRASENEHADIAQLLLNHSTDPNSRRRSNQHRQARLQLLQHRGD